MDNKKNLDKTVESGDVTSSENIERRTFLKKAAYAAPTLIALGFLTRPKKAQADFGPPPSDPDWTP